jgi:hypothetical protein
MCPMCLCGKKKRQEQAKGITIDLIPLPENCYF